ncbi:DUF2066 domain-containing protein [Pseudomonas sp. RIT-PI-AD]|uniref:DUF2066 domain-containing protein n=1 Tax=Pseudomonas sp. RIT-PI-AD TaxID=3035294 RepID=UPI0021D80BBA|nr:DUF2066 domain-containing protein [Pseudomonas sp. RIT-PI-AD]
MRAIARLLVLCLSLPCLPAFAENLATLYQVREAVASQQPEARDQGIQRALDTLLMRLTGNRNAAQNPALAALRKDPQQVIGQYGYEGDVLVVDFDPVSTDRSLRQAGLPLWGTNRPSVLVWWLNETAEGANLLGDGQDAAKPVRDAGEHRGLPLRLPLADLSEQLVATPAALEAAQPDALRPVSERYAADALLAVHAREENGAWRAQWRLWLGEQPEQGIAEAANGVALADAVMLAVSERLAPRFVVAPGAASSLTLEVQGADLGRYAELDRVLEPFGARLTRVEGDRLTYQVNASAEQLRAQLALVHLQEVGADSPPAEGAPQPAAQPAPTGVLRFRW